MIWFIFLLVSELTNASGIAAAALLSVRQEPEVIEVEPGGNVTMSCYYQGNFTEGDQVEEQWRRNFSIITAQRVNLTGTQERSFCLNLPSVRRNQSGTYVCKVSLHIPTLSTMEGNGTVLIVTDAAVGRGPRKGIPVALWTALAIAAVAVGTGFLICCKYRSIKPASSGGGRGCQESDAVQPEVQYATLNVTAKSPRPDSRGQLLGIGNTPESSRSPRNEEPSDAVYSILRLPSPSS